MALKSMTGFGRGQASRDGIKVDVELASVNRKQFDVRVGMPRGLAALEPKLDSLIHEGVSRGHVTGSVQLTVSGAALEQSVSVDLSMASGLLSQLRAAAEKLGVEDDLKLSDLVRLPDVLKQEPFPGEVDSLWPLVKRAIKGALKELVSMRSAEGAALQADLLKRLGKLRKTHASILRRSPKVPVEYARLLRGRLETVGVSLESADASLLREIALFADKADITEELSRMQSHFAQFDKLLKGTGVCGRTLDFVCQELFREINTTASKANDAEIARLAIAFKAELERMREQVQNVE